jgi:transcriptional regulator with XRE-family HTH domain
MINGEKVKELLLKKGMEEKELAASVGVSTAMITYIIKGLRDTSVTNAVRIAKELGCTVDEIIG